MCCVLAITPLVVGFPRLVYCLLSTCNQFGHLQIKSQWELIQKLHKIYLKKYISPLQGHALNGDISRQQKLMLDNISKGTYDLKVQRFLMCTKMVDNSLIIMMQNPLHVGKKLQNPLLSTTRIMFWGKHMASKIICC